MVADGVMLAVDQVTKGPPRSVQRVTHDVVLDVDQDVRLCENGA
jgi:hypothetical protein